MLTKTIKYTDYLGQEREEDFLFNLSKAEIMKMQLSTEGGFMAKINKAIKEQNVPAITEIFDDLILKSYGEISPDGKRFVKSKEISEAFSQTEAYTNLYMELISNPDAAQAFMNGVCPELTAEQKQLAQEELNKINK